MSKYKTINDEVIKALVKELGHKMLDSIKVTDLQNRGFKIVDWNCDKLSIKVNNEIVNLIYNRVLIDLRVYIYRWEIECV